MNRQGTPAVPTDRQDGPDAPPPFTGFEEVIGVYDADGGAIGEARYVIGKLLGRTHCALCDITHSPVRRKPAWDAMTVRLSVPITLLHVNEMPTDVAAATREHGVPAVFGRTPSGLVPLLSPSALDTLGGSVERFEISIREAGALLR